MAIPIPVERNIVVNERRPYYLTYSLCPETPQSIISNVRAYAYPVFSKHTLFVGFIDGFIDGVGTKTGVTEYLFNTSGPLWKTTGSRQGRSSEFAELLTYPVATKVPSSSAVSLSCSVVGSVLTVTIPFGPAIARTPDGLQDLWDNDMDVAADLRKYYYVALVGSVNIGYGYIDVPFKGIVPPVIPSLTVCSASVA